MHTYILYIHEHIHIEDEMCAHMLTYNSTHYENVVIFAKQKYETSKFKFKFIEYLRTFLVF